MKKTGKFPLAIFLISASLLAACGQSAAPAAGASAPTVASVPPAAVASAPAAASPVPTATASPVPAAATPPVLTLADCTLLSMGDIGAFLGGAVVDAREKIDPAVQGVLNRNTYCTYLTSAVKLQITFIDPSGDPNGSDGVMQVTRLIYPDAITIPGLGDDAFIHDLHGYLELFVRKGDSVNSIGLGTVTSAGETLVSPDNAQPMEVALAGLLLTALP